MVESSTKPGTFSLDPSDRISLLGVVLVVIGATWGFSLSVSGDIRELKALLESHVRTVDGIEVRVERIDDRLRTVEAR